MLVSELLAHGVLAARYKIFEKLVSGAGPKESVLNQDSFFAIDYLRMKSVAARVNSLK